MSRSYHTQDYAQTTCLYRFALCVPCSYFDC